MRSKKLIAQQPYHKINFLLDQNKRQANTNINTLQNSKNIKTEYRQQIPHQTTINECNNN